MNTPDGRAKRAERVAVFALSCLAFYGLACSDHRDRSGKPGGGVGEAPESVTVLQSDKGEIWVLVSPLSATPRAERFYREELDALIGSDRARGYARVQIAHLGETGSADVALGDLVLRVFDRDGREQRADDLASALSIERVKRSSLSYRALATWRGRSLSPGAALEAIAAFETPLAWDDLKGGELRLGDSTVRLSPVPMERNRLRQLHSRLSRDAILASVRPDGDAGDR